MMVLLLPPVHIIMRRNHGKQGLSRVKTHHILGMLGRHLKTMKLVNELTLGGGFTNNIPTPIGELANGSNMSPSYRENVFLVKIHYYK